MRTGQAQRLMSKSIDLNRALALLLMLSIVSALGSALVPQGGRGAASAFQGQDIVGGAAIIFKRPPKLRDIVGSAAMLVVERRTAALAASGLTPSRPSRR